MLNSVLPSFQPDGAKLRCFAEVYKGKLPAPAEELLVASTPCECLQAHSSWVQLLCK